MSLFQPDRADQYFPFPCRERKKIHFFENVAELKVAWSFEFLIWVHSLIIALTRRHQFPPQNSLRVCGDQRHHTSPPLLHPPGSFRSSSVLMFKLSDGNNQATAASLRWMMRRQETWSGSSFTRSRGQKNVNSLHCPRLNFMLSTERAEAVKLICDVANEINAN